MKIDREIMNLKQMTLKMSEVVLDNLQTAMQIFYAYDEEKANTINDDVVDLHERLIEEMSLTLMVKERPFASDLRTVTGILKLVEDLERLGDHASDIKKYAKKLDKVKKQHIESLDKTYQEASSMVLDAIRAFMNEDIELASKVINHDEIVDNLYEKTIEELIKNASKCDTSFAIYTTLVCKYIERIADHAVNVAEWVIYIVNGYHKDKQIF